MHEEVESAIRERVAGYFETLYRPGAGHFHAIVHAVENPATGAIAIAGPIYDAGGGFPVTRIGILGEGGAMALLSYDGSNDTDPRWSPDGATLAFLSDRGQGGGNFQLCLADARDLGSRRSGPVLAGEAVETFAWSADGRRILIQSADAGADAAGSASTARIGSAAVEARPSWMPTVETGGHDNQWRRARIWDLESGTLTDLGVAGQNVWEAEWCGPDEIVAILSASPTEGGWYQTGIGIAPASGGPFVPFAASDLELAKVCASPDGRRIAVLQGRFHRTVALGTLVLYDREGGEPRMPEVGAEISSLAWRDDTSLFFAGFRAPGTVAGTLDVSTGIATIEWESSGTAGRQVPYATPVGERAVLVPGHGSGCYPHLSRVEDGRERMVLDLANAGIRALIDTIGSAEAIRWRGRDGLEVQGYLMMPAGVVRPPLVVFIHGGPSHLFRDSWSFDNPLGALLVSQGYAVLFPNPRGSSGRGLDFASRVIGDWGGEDRHDVLAGIDHVIAHHGVDGARLFVTGGSYGGYMTTWLVTQTDRFSAACAIAPLSDMRSFFFTAHHPEFLEIYSKGGPYEVGAIFDTRSPLRHADKVSTPTMLIAGEMDKTTPPTQAIQFHHALILRDVPSELVLYPEEGHAAARLEAQVDQGVRVLRWFKTWEDRNGSDRRD